MMDRNAKTRRWLIKAENDLKNAFHEISFEDSALDTVCFHAQQAAEKYLKAFLLFHDRDIKRTHSLVMLIKDCMEVDESFTTLLADDIDLLTFYAVEVRYPDDFYIPTLDEAHESLEKTILVKRFVMERLEQAGFNL